MAQKIKMIWEFRGPIAKQTALHHEHHLQEYIEMESLKNNITGVVSDNPMHATTFMVVEQEEMIKVRDALRPHSAVYYEE